MYWGHEKPLPALSEQDRLLLEDPSCEIFLPSTLLRRWIFSYFFMFLKQPYHLGQTQMSNSTCNNLWHVSCTSRDAWPSRPLKSNGQNPEGIPWGVYNDQMPMFGQLSSPWGFLLSMPQIFLSSSLAKILLNTIEICCDLMPLNTWYFLRNLLAKAFRPRFKLSLCNWCFLLSANLWRPGVSQQKSQATWSKVGTQP